MAMRVFGRERGLAGAAERVHGDLHHRRRRIGLAQHVVQMRERLITAGEIRISRGYALEYARPRLRGGGATFRRRQDTVSALLRVIDTDQIGEDMGGEQSFRDAVLDAQDDQAAIALGARRRGDEMRHFRQGELRLVVILGQQHHEVATTLERIVHGEDEIRPARDIVVLQEHGMARAFERRGHFLRHCRACPAPADEEIDCQARRRRRTPRCLAGCSRLAPFRFARHRRHRGLWIANRRSGRAIA